MNISKEEYNQLKKDAARYRFLEQRISYCDMCGDSYIHAILYWTVDVAGIAPVDLTAAIDNEIERQNKLLNGGVKKPVYNNC